MSRPVYVLVSNKWPSFVYNSLDVLRKEEVLCDVTLQGSDGKTQLAHSCVLAGASSVLKSCLVQAPRGHYVVKIPSITAHLWDLLVSFVYQGRVKITASDRDNMLSAAQMLGLAELQGLCEACLSGGPEAETSSSAASSAAAAPLSAPSTSSAISIIPEEITVMDDLGNSGGNDDNNEEETVKAETDHGTFLRKKGPFNKGAATKYTCTQCGKSFPWGKALHVHELMHKQRKSMKHKCGTCNKVFNSYHSLRAHERTHTFQPYKCEICKTGFHFHVNYEIHMRKLHNVSDNKQYSCTLCGKEFVANGLLQRHMSTAHGLKKKEKVKSPKKSLLFNLPSKCGECNINCNTRKLLEHHFQSEHNIENPVYCEVCDNAFVNEVRLHEHYNIHIGKSEGVECGICGKFYKHKFALKLHETEAHNVKPEAKCDLCGLHLKTLRLLGKHMRIHEGQIGEDLWQCTICSTEFDNRPDFSMHLAEHRGEKTYACKYCTKGFTHKGNYQTHMQRHLGIKPYVCHRCNKSFVRKDDMKSHMRVHTGEKPFECNVCNMKFSCISNLREHERAKHNVSFSKRNPNVTVPRQQRNRVKYRPKNVAQVVPHEGSAELLSLVAGAFKHNGIEGLEIPGDKEFRIVIPQSASASDLCTVNYEVIENTVANPPDDDNTPDFKVETSETGGVVEEGEVITEADQGNPEETAEVLLEVPSHEVV